MVDRAKSLSVNNHVVYLSGFGCRFLERLIYCYQFEMFNREVVYITHLDNVTMSMFDLFIGMVTFGDTLSDPHFSYSAN